jgi:hypothetical protein
MLFLGLGREIIKLHCKTYFLNKFKKENKLTIYNNKIGRISRKNNKN